MRFLSPLRWPAGWVRGQKRPPASSGRFKTTFDSSRRRMLRALQKLGADNIEVTSHMPVRQDGLPRADQARRSMIDNGVSIYFMMGKRHMVMARDAYDSAFDNFHSLTMALEYLQGLERHGGATMMERAFEGFAALPAPNGIGFQKTWRELLGFPPDAHPTIKEAHANYRERVRRVGAHGNPDLDFGIFDLNRAVAEARKELAT